MRVSAFAAFAALAILATAALAATPTDSGWFLVSPRPSSLSPFHVGTGNTPGMAGQAVYVSGETDPVTTTWDSGRRYGAMERKFSFAGWRGRRVRVSLRLKTDGHLFGWTSLYLRQADQNGIYAYPQKTAAGSDAWERHQFVLDVPANATEATIAVGLAGKGRVWVDSLSVQPVTAAIPATNTRRITNSAPAGCGFHPRSESLSDTAYNCGPNVLPFPSFVARPLQ